MRASFNLVTKLLLSVLLVPLMLSMFYHYIRLDSCAGEVQTASMVQTASQNNITARRWASVPQHSSETAVSLSTCFTHLMHKRVDFRQFQRFDTTRKSFLGKFGLELIIGTSRSTNTQRRKLLQVQVDMIFGNDAPLVWLLNFDAQNMTEDEIECLAPKSRRGWGMPANVPDKGPLAVAIGHFSVYYVCMVLNYTRVLVLEDDADFVISHWQPGGRWLQIVQRHEIPKDTDIVFMGGDGMCGNSPGIHMKQVSESFWLAQSSRCAFAYLLSQKGARNMLRSLPIVAVIDFHMNYAVGSPGPLWPECEVPNPPKCPGKAPVPEMRFYHQHPPSMQLSKTEGQTWK